MVDPYRLPAMGLGDDPFHCGDRVRMRGSSDLIGTVIRVSGEVLGVLIDPPSAYVQSQDYQWELLCAYCDAAPEGNYAIHDTDEMDGREVPLCDGCGAHPEPTCRQIWDRIEARKAAVKKTDSTEPKP